MNKTFGRVAWHNQDIQQVAVEKLGRKLTAKELAKVRETYAVRHITDRMTEVGREAIEVGLDELD